MTDGFGDKWSLRTFLRAPKLFVEGSSGDVKDLRSPYVFGPMMLRKAWTLSPSGTLLKIRNYINRSSYEAQSLVDSSNGSSWPIRPAFMTAVTAASALFKS